MTFSAAKTACLEAEFAAQNRPKMEAGAIAAVKAEIKARRIKRIETRVRVVMQELRRRGWIAGIFEAGTTVAVGQNAFSSSAETIREGFGYMHQGDTQFAIKLLRAAGLEVEWDGDLKHVVNVTGLYVPTSAREILAARVA